MSSNLKRRVRERMEVTGERYTEARAALLAADARAASAEREPQRADLDRLLAEVLRG